MKTPQHCCLKSSSCRVTLPPTVDTCATVAQLIERTNATILKNQPTIEKNSTYLIPQRSIGHLPVLKVIPSPSLKHFWSEEPLEEINIQLQFIGCVHMYRDASMFLNYLSFDGLNWFQLCVDGKFINYFQCKRGKLTTNCVSQEKIKDSVCFNLKMKLKHEILKW